jgi:TRAP transporter 4TM/12TM fusion protein
MGEKLNFSTKVINIILTVVGIAMVIYQAITIFFYLQIPSGNLNTHLLFAFVIVFLTGAQKGKYRLLKILFALAGLLATLYIQVNVWDLEERAGGAHSILELAIGLTIMILSVIATWQEFGITLPILGTLFVSYGYLGHLLPTPFDLAPISFERLISNLCLNMEGIYGIILNVSASYIFFFMVFAATMNETGAIRFFHEIGKSLGNRIRGGAAVTSVVTSSMVGAISGQAGAIVAVTGSFTIPAMKKAGYKPEQAGGIEAAASTGGPIIPPVMGVAAFVMAGIIGVSYSKIILVAILPALLYVACCLFYVILQARKMNIFLLDEKVDKKELLARLPLFLCPLLVIIVLFTKNFTPAYVSFWATVVMILLSLFRKATRPSLPVLVKAFVNGAKLGSQIAVSCAFLGMMVKVITMTGLGVVLPQLLTNICGGNLVLLLIFTGVVSIILGMGLPAATSYIMVAVVMAPAMIGMGVPVLRAHFYSFYFCNFSYITPPVALACVFAAKLAEADYIKTGLEAVKVGMAGFIIPFMFIWCPGLLLDFTVEPIPSTVIKMIACFLLLLELQILVIGHYIISLNVLERVIDGVCSILTVFSLYYGNIMLFIIGTIIFIGLTFWQFKNQKAAIRLSASLPQDRLKLGG